MFNLSNYSNARVSELQPMNEVFILSQIYYPEENVSFFNCDPTSVKDQTRIQFLKRLVTVSYLNISRKV